MIGLGLEKLNYKHYPEYMFAMIAAYLPKHEGDDLRRAAGNIIFRHVDIHGNTYKNGVLHSYNDLPAIIKNDRKEWYKDGKLHRDGDIPAIIFSNTRKVWYRHGKFHREGDLPAITGKGYQEWYINGERHRDGDLPAVITKNLQ